MRRLLLQLVGFSLFLLLANSQAVRAQGPIAVGQTVEVATNGSVLNLRQGPGTSSPIVAKLPDGTLMTVVGGPQTADGYTWWELEGAPGRGWAAADFLRPAGSVEGATTNDSGSGVTSPSCAPAGRAMAGVSHCLRPDRKTQVVVIDLASPHIRFQTEMATAGTPPNREGTARASVEEMAERHIGVAAAINADYFGSGHGAEGLTIKNGTFLEPPPNNNRAALVLGRTFLDDPSVSGPVLAEIIRQTTNDPKPDTGRYYNAVGGGPQIVFDSVWEWRRGRDHPRYLTCASDADVINGECFYNSGGWETRTWTAIGITGDNKLIWVVGLPDEVQSAFEIFDVENALKLDGGGSSQLWYDGEVVFPSSDNRKVANALLVYSLHAAKVVEQSQWVVGIEKESFTIRVTLENIGADTWKAGEYALLNEENPLGAGSSRPLPRDVAPGETVTLEWTTDPISGWGVKQTRWRMAQGEVRFPGDAVTIQLVVLPEQLAKEKEKLERQIQQWIEEQKANIEQLIIKYIEDRLNDICRSLFGVAPLPVFAWLVVTIGRRRIGKR